MSRFRVTVGRRGMVRRKGFREGLIIMPILEQTG